MAEILYNNKCNGGVAQLGERLVRIQEVMGSNPTVSTTNKYKAWTAFRPGLVFCKNASYMHSVSQMFGEIIVDNSVF